MKISKAQCDMLMELMICIKKEWKIGIGYSCAFGSFVSDGDEFIIINDKLNKETGDLSEDDIYLFHNLDIETQRAGLLAKHEYSQYPIHDEKAENFMKKITNALENGILYFDPEAEITKNDKTYKVQKQADGNWHIRIRNATAGYTLGFCCPKNELHKHNLTQADCEAITSLMESLELKPTDQKFCCGYAASLGYDGNICQKCLDRFYRR